MTSYLNQTFKKLIFFCVVQTQILKFCARKSDKITPKNTREGKGVYIWSCTIRLCCHLSCLRKALALDVISSISDNNMCESWRKTVKEVKIHDIFVCAFKSQDFTQSQENFARSHDCETVTFRNCDLNSPLLLSKFLLLFQFIWVWPTFKYVTPAATTGMVRL